jgi:trk system potassium uptake protein
MDIVIVGAGEVGYHLARNLSSEGHDIVIIDNNPDKIQKINTSLDVMSILGEGTSLNILKRAGIENSGMLIAVTSTDEANLIACMIAKKYNVRTKIARVRNEDYSDADFVLTPEEMGVDMMINPELEAANEIVQLIHYPQAFDMIEVCEGRIVLLGILIDEDSPVIGKTLQEIVSSYEELTFRAVAISRQGLTIVPHGNEVVKPGDRFYVVVKKESIYEIFRLASQSQKEIRNIMLLGGGKIGRLAAEKLSENKQLNVKLIETNREKSRHIAEKLVNTLVVHGDGTDIDLLAQEGIIEMDAFVALTDDDESNIVSSLLARHLQVERTITLVSRGEYLPIIKTIGLDIAINKRILTSNRILRFIRRGSILSLNTLRGVDADTVEFQTPANCKVAFKMLRDVKFPKGVVVGAIVHDGEAIVPVGDTTIHPDDRVVVFTLPDSLKQVEKMFGG